MTAARMLARRLVAMAGWLLPPSLAPWAMAMLCELDAIADDRAALGFAFGCVRCGLREAALHVLAGSPSTPVAGSADTGRHSKGLTIMSHPSPVFRHPRAFGVACAVAASGFGIAYLAAAGAPARYLAINAAAVVIGGVLLLGIGATMRRDAPLPGAVAIALATALLATALFGTTIDGAARWIRIGGLSVQVSLLVLPLLIVDFARARGATATIAMVIAAIALALQPDRAMAGALATGLATLAMFRRDTETRIAFAASVIGFAVALARPDGLPAMPYVDGVLYSAFDVHAMAGAAVLGGVVLMLAPAVVGWLGGRGDPAAPAVFGATWLTIVIAAALGNYPTPVVGYGGSAIVGYLISLSACGRGSRPGAAFQMRCAASAPADDADTPPLRSVAVR